MKIMCFEDLDVWRLSRELTFSIYKATSSESFKKDFSLIDQLRRSSSSIMANIAEGFERQTPKEFIQFLFIAKGSSGELRSHLYLSLDLGYLSQEQFSELTEKAVQISKSLSGFIKYLRKSNS